METISADQRELLIAETLRRAGNSYEFYRRVIADSGVSLDRVSGMADLLKLPILTKDQVLSGITRERVMEQLRGKLALIGFTSGSTGTPSPVYYSHSDLDTWELELSKALSGIGMSSEDIVQVSIGQCGTGCLALFGAIRRAGAAAIPIDVSGASGPTILAHIVENQVSILLTYPAIARELCRVARESDGRALLRGSALHTLVLMGEPWTEALRHSIKEALGTEIYDIYGSTEAGMVGIECACHQGLHVFEDRLLVEILDPVTGEPLAPGVEGEVVLTPYWKEGLPLLRYGTGDAAAIIDGECECGSALPRITRIRGRCRDMVFVGSTKFYPGQLEAIVAELFEGSPNYQLQVESTDSGRDMLTLAIEAEPMFSCLDEREYAQALAGAMSALSPDLPGMIASGFVEGPTVSLVPPGSIERRSGKIPSVIDLRRGRAGG